MEIVVVDVECGGFDVFVLVNCICEIGMMCVIG